MESRISAALIRVASSWIELDLMENVLLDRPVSMRDRVAMYLLITTGFWPLYPGVVFIPLALWVTRKPETSGDRHMVVQLACLLAIMTALGMQGALTL